MTNFYGNPDYWKNWNDKSRWTDGRWLAKKN